MIGNMTFSVILRAPEGIYICIYIYVLYTDLIYSYVYHLRNEIAKIKRAETRLLERTKPPIQDRRAAIINNMSDDSDDQDQPQ